MIDNVEVFCQNSIKIKSGKTIYVDPLNIDKEYHDADMIFITHDHYDHFSLKDISRIINDKTKIILPKKMVSNAKQINIDKERIFFVNPNEKYNIGAVLFETVPSYNKIKPFHPKGNNWVGYIIKMDKDYYIAGDTDALEELKSVKCDVAFIPIGGVYTMDYKEAAKLVNSIKPDVIVPVHYGSIVGDIKDGQRFKELIDKDIKCEIYIK